MFGFAKKLVSSLESQLSQDASPNTGTHVDESRLGLRILSVRPDSLGLNHGMESWFDYIVALNGTDINAYLELDSSTGYVGYDNFLNYMKHEVEVAGNGITLTVFSSKGSVLRDIYFSNSEIIDACKNAKPPLEEISLNEEEEGANQSGLAWNPHLGLSFQLTPLSTAYFTWHVLRVLPGSPAYLAGIMPDEYIIQSQDGLLATGGEDLLGKVLQSQYAKNGDGGEVVLYVYNYDSDCVRPVTIVLKSGALWGGRGILGCDVGYGLLHRIPEVVGKFDTIKSFHQELPQSQGASTVTEGAFEVSMTEPPEFLPLQVSAPSFSSDGNRETAEEAAKAVANAHRKRGPHGGKKTNVNLDDYFKEQTAANESSSSTDITTKSSVPPPPPPKKA